MLDISVAAIERELATAQANAGRQQETSALARAQIIATLLTAGIGQPTIPPLYGDQDRVQITDPYYDNNPYPQDDVTVAKLDATDRLPPVDDDDEFDGDFFAEARKERGH